MTKLEELQAIVDATEKAYNDAVAESEKFNSIPENNVFNTIADARKVLHTRVYIQAENDFESGHFGSHDYTQEFIVDNVYYIGKLEVTYSKYDNYITSSKFTIHELNK